MHDKQGRERLCRYILRPPLANERLSILEDGKVRLGFKRPWSDGTSSVQMEPLAPIARLAADTAWMSLESGRPRSRKTCFELLRHRPSDTGVDVGRKARTSVWIATVADAARLTLLLASGAGVRRRRAFCVLVVQQHSVFSA